MSFHSSALLPQPISYLRDLAKSSGGLVGRLRSFVAMWCSLARLCEAQHVATGPTVLFQIFNFTVQVFVFLEPVDQLYLARASLVIFVDRAELSLYATAVRLDLEWLSSYSGPTPPLAPW